MKKIGKFRAAFLNWLGVPVHQGDYPINEAGQKLTSKSVLGISAVWACVGLISESIASLPFGFYRKTPDGREQDSMHPLYRVLRAQPNADMTAVQFWQAFLLSMLLRGNGYAEILVSAGRVIGLRFLHPDFISWRVLQSGVLEYRYTYRGKIQTIPENRMLHIPALSSDGRVGISPISAGAAVFGSAQASNKVANSTFEKGLHPTVAFKYPSPLKPDQREEARETIKKLSGAVNAGNPVILEAGMEAFNIGINPRDAQLLQSREFSVEEIARWFRVPPHMIGHTTNNTSWGSGIEQQMLGFVRFTLRPWLTRIEQGVNRALLMPNERNTHYAEFAVEGLLRGDSAARQSFYASALQNGWMNRNQVAKLENMPAIPGGDIFTVQGNLVPLDELGQQSDSETVRQAMKRWLGDDDEQEKDTRNSSREA